MMKMNRFRVLGVLGCSCVVVGIWMTGRHPEAVVTAGGSFLLWAFAEMVCLADSHDGIGGWQR